MDRLRVDSLSRFFGGVRALDSVTLAIAPGEVLALLGHSGAGKTTLLRLIAGLDDPDAGTIERDGRSLRDVPPHRRGVGYLASEAPLYPHLDVLGNLRFRRVGVDDDPRTTAEIDRLADLLDISGLLGRRIDQISAGERRRVALARALLGRPPILLLDEPLTNLDPPIRAALRPRLAAILREIGASTLLVTHDQAEASALGDRQAVLDRGALLQVGPPGEVYDHPADVRVARFLGDPPMSLLRAFLDRDGAVGIVTRPRGIQPILAPFPPPELPADHSGEVLLGIRPEGLATVGEEAGSDLLGRITRVEGLGGQRIATIDVSGQYLTARFGTDTPNLADGSLVYLTIDRRRARFFDRETGRALQPAAPESRPLTPDPEP